MQVYPENRPELFDQYGEPLWHDDEIVIAGECFADDACDIYVNLLSRPDGLFVVRVYDCDDGGPITYWVDELFDNEAEAREQYDGRVVEAHAGVRAEHLWFGRRLAVWDAACTLSQRLDR